METAMMKRLNLSGPVSPKEKMETNQRRVSEWSNMPDQAGGLGWG